MPSKRSARRSRLKATAHGYQSFGVTSTRSRSARGAEQYGVSPLVLPASRKNGPCSSTPLMVNRPTGMTLNPSANSRPVRRTVRPRSRQSGTAAHKRPNEKGRHTSRPFHVRCLVFTRPTRSYRSRCAFRPRQRQNPSRTSPLQRCMVILARLLIVDALNHILLLPRFIQNKELRLGCGKARWPKTFQNQRARQHRFTRRR